MNTKILLKQKKGNYFYNFNFLKLKQLIIPLTIVALLFIVKQFITNNFNISKPHGTGLLDLLDPYTGDKVLPDWAKTVNLIIDVLIMIVILCWEAVSEKKYDKIKFVLLLSLPSLTLLLIGTYSDIYQSSTSSFATIYYILGYFHYYALYGAFRRKILYGKNLSLIGYLIGMIAIIDITILYQKISSVLLYSDLFTSVYSYGLALSRLSIPLSFFYFVFLSDAGFSVKNLFKMPSTVFIPNKKFTTHFLFLCISLLTVHLYFTDHFSIYWFNHMTLDFSSIFSNTYNLIRFMSQIAFVYLVFSKLLLLQLNALGKRPLWIYLWSFVPVVNLFVLFFFFRKKTPPTDAEDFIVESNEERNRLYLQLFVLFLASFYSIKKFGALGLSDQNLYLTIGLVLLLYIFIVFLRIGIWITLAIICLLFPFFLFYDLPTGFYYFGISSYVAIGLYNLHIALFWPTEEWSEIGENITMETEKS